MRTEVLMVVKMWAGAFQFMTSTSILKMVMHFYPEDGSDNPSKTLVITHKI
jgi:hypothetical protein